MALTVEYSSRFVRTFRKLDPALQEEVIEKVGLLKSAANHKNVFLLETIGTHDEVYE
jgi:hypothetical protein